MECFISVRSLSSNFFLYIFKSTGGPYLRGALYILGKICSAYYVVYFFLSNLDESYQIYNKLNRC